MAQLLYKINVIKSSLYGIRVYDYMLAWYNVHIVYEIYTMAHFKFCHMHRPNIKQLFLPSGHNPRVLTARHNMNILNRPSY